MKTLTKLDQIHSRAAERNREISQISNQTDRLLAEANLLLSLRRRTEEALSEEHALEFPGHFIEECFHLEPGASAQSILAAWVSEELLRHRDDTFGDLYEAEWRNVLGITRRVVGDAFVSPVAGMIRRDCRSDELIIRHALYERKQSDQTLQASPQDKRDELIVTLRLAEAIHRETPFCITAVDLPPVLIPEDAISYQPRQIYQWHPTFNEGIPKVRVLANGGLILRFAKEATLQKLKELLGAL